MDAEHLDHHRHNDIDSDDDVTFLEDEDRDRLAQQEHEARIKQQIDHILEVDLWSTGLLQRTSPQALTRFVYEPQRVLQWKRLDTRQMHETIGHKPLQFLAHLLLECLTPVRHAETVVDQWLFRQFRRNFFYDSRVL